MILDELSDIVQELKEYNGFSYAVFYKDTLSFKNGGISDEYKSMLYIRKTGQVKQKPYADGACGVLYEESVPLVLVLMFPYENCPEKIARNLMSQLNEFEINGFDDDAMRIFKAETQKDLKADIGLISVDLVYVKQRKKYKRKACLEL